MTEKIMRFRGRKKNLGLLANQIEYKLARSGYEVQTIVSDGYGVKNSTALSGIVIQARREGALKSFFATNKAFTIMIKGRPNDFMVRLGVGKLVQNVPVTATESMALSDLFLPLDVPDMIWSEHIENGLAKDITMLANSGISHEEYEELSI